MIRPLRALLFVAATLPVVAQSVVDPRLAVAPVYTSDRHLTGIEFIGDDDFLLLQKNDGRVRRIRGGVAEPLPVLDVHVEATGERGLLGMALDPDFDHSGFVYLYYTESSTGADTFGGVAAGNRVYRYRWNGSTLVEPLLLLDLPALTTNHNGGVLRFGPDDRLYAMIGDQGRTGKLQNVASGPAPDGTSAIFRIGSHGEVLPDNPLSVVGQSANPLGRYMAYGVRNGFGMAFDPRTGDLWDTENGAADYDEINRVVPGFNSGWIRLMGPAARDPQGTSDLWVAAGSVYRDPEFSWKLPVGPTAMGFVTGPILGCDLLHDLLVGDVNCTRLRRFELNAARDGLAFSAAELQDRVADNDSDRCDGEQDELSFGSDFSIITDIDTAPDGSLYITKLDISPLVPQGVYRIAPVAGSVPDADGDLVDDACDCDASAAGSFAAPTEVPRLRLSGQSPLGLGWNSQRATAGSGTTYAVVSGAIADLGLDSGFASACTLAVGLPAARADDLRPDPAPDAGFYYLVRAANDCAAGTFGSGSLSPDPRDALDLTLPPPCTP